MINPRRLKRYQDGSWHHNVDNINTDWMDNLPNSQPYKPNGQQYQFGAWGNQGMDTQSQMNSFQQESKSIAEQTNPVIEMDTQQNTRATITGDQPEDQPENNHTKKSRSFGMNPAYIAASNLAFTGLGILGNKNGNSYQNAQNNYNMNRNSYENMNNNTYSTKQDFYGKYQKGGGIKDLYETLSLDPEYYNDELSSLKSDYDKYNAEQETDRFNNSIKDYIDAQISGLPKQKKEEDNVQYNSYNPYDNWENPNISWDEVGEDGNMASYMPSVNVGFNNNIKNFKTGDLYKNSQALQGMHYQMGAKGSNGKIDCSGAVCKIVGQPTMTSEDVTRKGNNFRNVNNLFSLKEGTVLGFDFGPKKHDVGRKYGIDHTGVIVKNPTTGKLEYKESASKVGFRTLTLDQLNNGYLKRAKNTYASDYKFQNGGYVPKVLANAKHLKSTIYK